MKNTQLLNTQQSANTTTKQNFGINTKKNKKNKELIKRTIIENTPFTIIEINEEYFITMGSYRISEKFKTLEEATEEANTINWNKIIQVISILMDHEKKIINLKNEEK